MSERPEADAPGVSRRDRSDGGPAAVLAHDRDLEIELQIGDRSQRGMQTATRWARSSSSNVSRLWVKEAMSLKPNVALPPFIECATRKIVLISSGSGAPTLSCRSAASIESRASKLSSKNAA